MANDISHLLNAPPEVLDSLASKETALELGELVERVVDFNTVAPEPYGVGIGSSEVGWFRRREWGVSWNAYAAERRSPTEVYFECAWSHCRPLLVKLSRKFPEAVIGVKWSCEINDSMGEYTLQNGEVLSERQFAGEDEMNEFQAQLVWGISYAQLEAEREADHAAYEAEQAAKKARAEAQR